MGMTDFNNVDIDMKDMKDKMRELDKCISMMYYTYHECPIPDDDKLLKWSFNLIKNLEAAKPYIAQHCTIRCHMNGSEHHVYLYNQLESLKKLLFDKDECRLTKKKK